MSISEKLWCLLIAPTLRLLDPPEVCAVWEWAERNRYLGKDVTGEPGKYKCSIAPFQREPQESFTDKSVQVTVLMWASRLGKTEIMQSLIGHQMATNPRNILFVYPTLDSARKSSKQFFTPMIRSSPALRNKIRDAKARGSGNTMLAKQFPGGTISWIGANSPSAFRQVQAPVVLCDEIDAMENSPEGDPVTLAAKRADNYSDNIQVLSSTPTIKGASRIEAAYEETDKRKWFVPCPNCGEKQTLEWKNLRWTEGAPESAWYQCRKCEAHWTDADRCAAVRAGEWRATAPFHGKRGYFLSGLCSPFKAKRGYVNKMHQMVAEFLEAKHKGKEAERVWVNTFLAETWEESGETLVAETIRERLEPYPANPLPEKVLVLTAAADVQKDRIQAEIVGWGEADESWGLASVTLAGDPEHPAVWERLYQFFDQSFHHPWGFELKPRVCCVDSGYATKQCYSFCEKSGRDWYPVKGIGNRLRELVMAPARRSRSKAWLVDVGAFKSTLYSWLKITEAGPRYCHFPKLSGYDDEYFAQLTAEKRRLSMKFGQPVYTWENVRPNKRNEALDVRVYNHAALFILRPDWPRLKANLQKRITQKPTDPEPQQSPVVPAPIPPHMRRVPLRGNSWVNKWR